jgi:hypothetical protein
MPVGRIFITIPCWKRTETVLETHQTLLGTQRACWEPSGPHLSLGPTNPPLRTETRLKVSCIALEISSPNPTENPPHPRWEPTGPPLGTHQAPLETHHALLGTRRAPFNIIWNAEYTIMSIDAMASAREEFPSIG